MGPKGATLRATSEVESVEPSDQEQRDRSHLQVTILWQSILNLSSFEVRSSFAELLVYSAIASIIMGTILTIIYCLSKPFEKRDTLRTP